MEDDKNVTVERPSYNGMRAYLQGGDGAGPGGVVGDMSLAELQRELSGKDDETRKMQLHHLLRAALLLEVPLHLCGGTKT